MRINICGSKAKSLSTYDLGQTAKLGVKIFLVAGFTAVAQWATGQDFGAYGPVVSSVALLLVDLVNRWISDTQTLPVKPPEAARPGDVVQDDDGKFAVCKYRIGGELFTSSFDEMNK